MVGALGGGWLFTVLGGIGQISSTPAGSVSGNPVVWGRERIMCKCFVNIGCSHYR